MLLFDNIRSNCVVVFDVLSKRITPLWKGEKRCPTIANRIAASPLSFRLAKDEVTRFPHVLITKLET